MIKAVVTQMVVSDGGATFEVERHRPERGGQVPVAMKISAGNQNIFCRLDEDEREQLIGLLESTRQFDE